MRQQIIVKLQYCRFLATWHTTTTFLSILWENIFPRRSIKTVHNISPHFAGWYTDIQSYFEIKLKIYFERPKFLNALRLHSGWHQNAISASVAARLSFSYVYCKYMWLWLLLFFLLVLRFFVWCRLALKISMASLIGLNHCTVCLCFISICVSFAHSVRKYRPIIRRKYNIFGCIWAGKSHCRVFDLVWLVWFCTVCADFFKLTCHLGYRKLVKLNV